MAQVQLIFHEPIHDIFSLNLGGGALYSYDQNQQRRMQEFSKGVSAIAKYTLEDWQCLDRLKSGLTVRWVECRHAGCRVNGFGLFAVKG